MSLWEALLIFAGGLVAGVINAMAGGGSLITVPLLSIAGVEGLNANGTNRVAVVVQSASSALGFARRGVDAVSETVKVALPVVAGAIVGAIGVSQIDDDVFERAFGVLMIPLLVLVLWKPNPKTADEPWSIWVSTVLFFGVGLYAGAIQAGVGIILLLVLARAGYDLVTANAIKTLVIVVASVFAVAIFIVNGQVEWGPAIVLSVGMGLGGYLGAHIAVEGGERVIKPVLVVSVVALSIRMIFFS